MSRRNIQPTDRRYPPLRSAPSTSIGEPAPPPQAPIVKKRRLGVVIACNVCRRRKIRCDGRRPTCINCDESGNECTYRDQAEVSPEAGKLVVEVVKILNSMPTKDAIWTLQLLSGEANAPTIMSTLREKASSRQKLAGEDLNIPETRLEFEIQHPVAYPSLALVSPDVLTMQPLAGKLPSSRDDHVDNQVPSSAYLTIPRSPAGTGDEFRNVLALSTKKYLPSRTQTDGNSPASPSSELCNSRLQDVDIQFWTDVKIDQDVAIKCLSLYFMTDHPVLANFDTDLFVTSLVAKSEEHCSRLLVNALLYWAYQIYSSITPETYTLALDFCAEAEKLWRDERRSGRDSIETLAAAEFLCLGYMGQGRDHAVLAYVSEASRMGQRMGLFGMEPEEDATTSSDYATDSEDDATRARRFTAWGVFNWITLMSLFYRQPGMDCPKYPPRISIPEPSTTEASKYMGVTFPQICRFWVIVHEVTMVYDERGRADWGSGAALSFAEFKFRELLAWSNTLPSRVTRDSHHTYHVDILHIWFHAAILDIFRPFVKAEERERQMRTFAGTGTTINAVCAASVAQLKHLIVSYQLNYRQSSYSILWHTAIIYVANAILSGEGGPNWYPDLLLCIYAYETLNRSWRVAASIAKSLLSLAMKRGKISSSTARRVISEINNGGAGKISDEIRATFMADLNLALSDPGSATVEHLANQLETNMLFGDLTFAWEDEQ